MEKFSIVIDTKVIISALRSRRGASFKLISMLKQDTFHFNISVPLVLEYESIIWREVSRLN